MPAFSRFLIQACIKIKISHNKIVHRKSSTLFTNLHILMTQLNSELFDGGSAT